MKFFANRKGFALVTALMLMLVSLTIVMALLYMITQGTQQSGLNRKYHTALEASYGGAELFTKDILPFIMSNYSSNTLVADLAKTSNFGAVTPVVGSQKCLQIKLKTSRDNWPAACFNTADPNYADPKSNPDMTFTMQATAGNPFLVYTKIVDTVKGNTDISGLQLGGAGVAETTPVISPQHFPYIYRVEIRGERQLNSTSRANIEVLYAY
jgi:hypothetical protein